MTWTVPTIERAAFSATSKTRSPRAILAAVSRQKASALARVIGSMKLTDAPPSTQSINTSPKPWISRSPRHSRLRIRMRSDASSLRTRRPRGYDDDVPGRLARRIPKRCGLTKRHGKATVLRQEVGITAHRYFNAPILHPDLLMNAGVAVPRFIGHTCPSRQYNIDDLYGRGKIGRRDVSPHVA